MQESNFNKVTKQLDGSFRPSNSWQFQKHLKWKHETHFKPLGNYKYIKRNISHNK